MYDLSGKYYIISRRLRCSRCTSDIAAHSEDLVKSLPEYIQLGFPALLSQRSGVDKNLPAFVESLCDKSVGPTGIAATMKELAALE